jgi:hypothetical protein
VDRPSYDDLRVALAPLPGFATKLNISNRREQLTV